MFTNRLITPMKRISSRHANVIENVLIDSPDCAVGPHYIMKLPRDRTYSISALLLSNQALI